MTDAVLYAEAAASALARQDPSLFVRLAGRDEKGRQVDQAAVHRLMQYHISYAWNRGQHAVIVGPPEHGKSVQLIYRLIWELGRDTSKRIAVIAGNEGLAMDRIQSIRSIIVENDDVRRVFPGLRPSDSGKLSKREWRMSRFFIEREGEAVDPSVQAAAIFGKTEGKRVDLLWCDDTVTREDWLSDAQRQKTIDTWFNTWSKRLGSAGLAVFTNNCWHRKDLIHRLREIEGYAVLWMGIPDSCDAIQAEALHVGEDYVWAPGGGRFALPLWTFIDENGQEQGWTRQRLLKHAQADSASFRRVFGGRALDVANMTFRPVEQWPTYQRMDQIPSWGSAPVVAFVDPSTGRGKGDFTAIVVAALGGDGRFYLLEVVMSQDLQPSDCCRKLFDLHDWIAGTPGRGGRGFHDARIETNNFQAIFLDLAATVRAEYRAARRRYEVPLRGLDVRDKKELRILGLQPVIDHGWLVVPEDASRRWPALFEQIEGYGPESTPEHDDGPDALASCVALLQGVNNLPSADDVRDSRELTRSSAQIRGW